MAKRLILKYAGECVACGAELDAGAEAIWWSRGRVSCLTCDGRMSEDEYQERRDAKVERFRGYADNARVRSNTALETASQIADMIPAGQPILVGHHSEGHHRRDLARIDRNMRRGIDEHDRAEHWDRRARGAEHDTTIHADDPLAVDKLRDKIAELEAQRERIKTVNRLVRKAAGKDPSREHAAEIIAAHPDLTARERATLLSDLTMYHGIVQVGYPGYVLSNLGANIRRYQQRLKGLERLIATFE